jgi:hypothetical protein
MARESNANPCAEIFEIVSQPVDLPLCPSRLFSQTDFNVWSTQALRTLLNNQPKKDDGIQGVWLPSGSAI